MRAERREARLAAWQSLADRLQADGEARLAVSQAQRGQPIPAPSRWFRNAVRLTCLGCRRRDVSHCSHLQAPCSLRGHRLLWADGLGLRLEALHRRRHLRHRRQLDLLTLWLAPQRRWTQCWQSWDVNKRLRPTSCMLHSRVLPFLVRRRL